MHAQNDLITAAAVRFCGHPYEPRTSMFALPWEPLKSKEMNMSMKNDAAKAIKEFVEERTGDLGIPVYC